MFSYYVIKTNIKYNYEVLEKEYDYLADDILQKLLQMQITHMI